MQDKYAYKRVLLKLSGEALAGEGGTGLDFRVMSDVCAVIAQAARDGVEIGIVVGGGNFWRGVKNGEGRMDRAHADQMGMLATVMNCLALQDVIRQQGVEARVFTAMRIESVGEPFTLDGADAILLAKNVDGVYSADPKKDPNAVKYDALSYAEVLERRLAVMDSTATCLAMDNNIPVLVFALKEPGNILRALSGENVGTLVK